MKTTCRLKIKSKKIQRKNNKLSFVKKNMDVKEEGIGRDVLLESLLIYYVLCAQLLSFSSIIRDLCIL